jgi:itaconyl-CoA hydratase/mesaconyl-C4 CoA hydratase
MNTTKPQFSQSYTPTPTLLFRFSAVSQNEHKIHLDEAYCHEVEGLPGTLTKLIPSLPYSDWNLLGLVVHGPLTALLLTQLACQNRPDKKYLSRFQYRATHPLIANQVCRLEGVLADDHRTMRLWATSEEGIIGMKAKATFENS